MIRVRLLITDDAVSLGGRVKPSDPGSLLPMPTSPAAELINTTTHRVPARLVGTPPVRWKTPRGAARFSNVSRRRRRRLHHRDSRHITTMSEPVELVATRPSYVSTVMRDRERRPVWLHDPAAGFLTSSTAARSSAVLNG